MLSSTFTFTATDGIALFVYRWSPDAALGAVVRIAHDLAEHTGRDARLAEALTGAGCAVYAADPGGHGRTACTSEDLGFFARRDGRRKCIDGPRRLSSRASHFQADADRAWA
jgi:alpha-beta hydrolase superfamily lysophospholipase